MKEKHKFAIYVAQLSRVIPEELYREMIIKITDRDICKRIKDVLRLQNGDELTIFNRNKYFDCSIKAISKNEIEIEILSKSDIKPLKPEIHIFIGLLKKDSFENVLYDCVELGATSITPILSEKIHKNWFSESEPLGESKYKNRFEKILIAAAEQSKNFCLPKIFEPIEFDTFIVDNKSQSNILLDVSGEYVLDIFNRIKDEDKINLVVGPEGDFSAKEKELMIQNNFKVCRLTPTVLRSIQAVDVGLGVFGALFNF